MQPAALLFGKTNNTKFYLSPSIALMYHIEGEVKADAEITAIVMTAQTYCFFAKAIAVRIMAAGINTIAQKNRLSILNAKAKIPSALPLSGSL